MDSKAVKDAVFQQVVAESNLANARVLIEKIQENCFEKCITKPGSSISSGEQSCATACMEKYMNAWNHVNSAYITRARQEGAGTQ
ncbi:unnamed protein product [Clonostachys rosea f. rosea IK726]|uniref:Mitochondrial import inner membrane translocase subunit n=4 Tax=Clonostachys TaxID=110564 RepID=A0A0B7JS58_BIOOC|nr:unnamed protein product [Clonostachys rosea f. rosea IK726]CAH0052124.1 unnamed protein product [Clonostachys rhizophaga]CAI6088895.1 unnamed protein product [Clonostachys chloroleuca]